MAVCLDASAISFRIAWKDSVQFVPMELPQINITSINEHRIQHFYLFHNAEMYISEERERDLPRIFFLDQCEIHTDS